MPSYLGSSLSFVGVAAVIGSQGGGPAEVTGALFVVGPALAVVGLVVQRMGAKVIHAVLPPAVTGAVVMLIGFNLAPVAAGAYWPQDQWTALATLLFTGLALVVLRGFRSRIAIFLGLVFGYVLSWILDAAPGKIHSADSTGKVVDQWRLDLTRSRRRTGSASPACMAPHSVRRRSSWRFRSSSLWLPRTPAISRRSER